MLCNDKVYEYDRHQPDTRHELKKKQRYWFGPAGVWKYALLVFKAGGTYRYCAGLGRVGAAHASWSPARQLSKLSTPQSNL
jgi:hypothetical protein